MISFYPVHTNTYVYVCARIKFLLKTSASFDALKSHDDNENMAARVQKCIYLSVYTPVRKRQFGRYPLW